MKPATALSAVVRDATRARDAEYRLYDSVRTAREAGVTWALIGQALGVSASAAYQRFSKPPRGRIA